jgi:MYXO-CTERM domain-containing protein
MKRALSLAVLAAGLLGATRPADAYVRTVTDRMVPVHWRRPCVTLIVHNATPPANLTPDLVVSAAQAAAATWSTPAVSCTSWIMSIAVENTADATVANDQKNNLVFRTTDWAYDPSALAITTVFAQQSDGLILDADVELNAAGGRFLWGDLVAAIGTDGGAEDLQNTLTHEFGHLLGLDHNCFLPGNPHRAFDDMGVAVPECDRASPDVQDATMFAAVTRGDTLRRTLAPDDLAGVCAIYPTSFGLCTDGGDGLGGHGCSVGANQTAASGGAFLVLAAAGLAVSARRRRARARG